jgi:hypothetical protein
VGFVDDDPASICGVEGWKYFYMHRDIIFGYQLLQNIIVQKGKYCSQEGIEEE